MNASAIGNVRLELSVVLGSSLMPVNQLLRMGRGSVIELNTLEDEQVSILVNNVPVAYGKVHVTGEKISITIAKKLKSREVNP